MISHVKLLKPEGAPHSKSKQVFYVKDTDSIYRYSIDTKEEVPIGKCSDAILAMSVTNNVLRSVDREVVVDGDG